MRISASQNSREGTGGFTLVEILVVLLIITIVAGMAIVRFPSMIRSADLDEESRRLELLFTMARNEALLDSVEFGFRLTRDGYDFLVYSDAEQAWLSADAPYHERKLDDALKLELKASRQKFLTESQDLPPVLILSSGETTPFDLELSSLNDNVSRTLSTDGYGEFTWQENE